MRCGMGRSSAIGRDLRFLVGPRIRTPAARRGSNLQKEGDRKKGARGPRLQNPWTSMLDIMSCFADISSHEEPPEGAARRARLEPGSPGRAPRGLAPDGQRHRDGEVRPEPAARLRDRAALRAPDRGRVPARRRAHEREVMNASTATDREPREKPRSRVTFLVLPALFVLSYFVARGGIERVEPGSRA